MKSSFGTRGTIETGSVQASIYRLSKLARDGIGAIDILSLSRFSNRLTFLSSVRGN